MSSTITALTSGGGLAMAGDTSGQLELKTNNGTTAVTVTTAQDVGIGTTSPSSKLDVSGVISLQGTTLPSAGTARIFSRTSDSSTYIQTATGGTAYLLDGSQNTMAGFGSSLVTFATSNTERMRITSDGYLFINTTSALSGGAARVALKFDGGATWGMGIQTTYSGGTGSRYMQFINSAGSETGNINQNGTTTVAYTTSSDYRLKEDIAPMTNALATVSALKPVTYKWKVDGSNGQGFIAHELQAVVPDCVTGEKDDVQTYTDEDGNEQTRIKPQGVDTSFLVATLTAAIQELNAKVDAQALEIQALKGVA
jgi:hypothetical protein